MRLYRRKPKPGQEQNLTWHYDFDYKGVTVRKSTKRTSRKDAERFARAEETKYKNRIDGIGVAEDEDVPAVTLDALAEQYLEWARDDHPATADDVDALVIKRFAEIVGGGDTLIHTITPFSIHAWRTQRRKDTTPKGGRVSASTIDRQLSVLRSMFSKAVELKFLAVSPCATVKDFRPPFQPVRILTPEEVERAFDLPEPYNLFCEVTYRTLARLGEVVSLRAEHVTIDRLPDGQQIGTLTKQVKGGVWKRVRIPLPLAQKLRAYVTSPDQTHIFPGYRHANTVSARLTVLFRAAGLRCSHHAFRHTGITRMLDAGVSPRAIQEHAGWGSLAQLQRYGRVTDYEFARAVEAPGEFLAKARAERDAAAKAEREALALLKGGKK